MTCWTSFAAEFSLQTDFGGWRELDPIAIESLFALFFGIGWVENLSSAAVHRALEMIYSGLKSKSLAN